MSLYSSVVNNIVQRQTDRESENDDTERCHLRQKDHCSRGKPLRGQHLEEQGRLASHTI